jgi:hypothetical protein
MIHHFSIQAENPLHVATVLAEIIAGEVIPFPDHPNSFLALTLDAYGTFIEVLPHQITFVPGLASEPVQWDSQGQKLTYNAFHAALSVAMSEEQIRTIAQRAGWRVGRGDRGDDFFSVIEVWIENRQFIEFLPPELAEKYLAFMQPTNLRKLMHEEVPTEIGQRS